MTKGERSGAIKFSLICDRGLARQENQDAVFSHAGEKVAFFCVADGMGGHSHGERASGAIINRIQRWTEEEGEASFRSITDMAESFEEIVREVNSAIYEEGGEKTICGSTLVALLMMDDTYAVLSAGDSRIYKKSGRDFLQVTRDDVWESAPDVTTLLSEKQRRDHPNYGKLTKAVGVDKTISLSAATGRLEGETSFLLCSDGIYKYVKEGAIRRAMRKGFPFREDPEERLLKLQREVMKNKAPDNYSAILIDVEETYGT